METNAPKSKFVYPDKLYARCKDNKTLDISYAPQTLEAAEYIKKDAFIEKACKWLIKELINFEEPVDTEKTFIQDFRNYMKGE